jgi:hypothetical protein
MKANDLALPVAQKKNGIQRPFFEYKDWNSGGFPHFGL